jgi:hypothetical protein
MKTTMVRYKTAQTRGDENQLLVREVFDELRARAPTGLRYAAYRLADQVTFVHIATFDTADHSSLTGLVAFKAFQRQLGERCVDRPVVTEMNLVDCYGSPS